MSRTSIPQWLPPRTSPYFRDGDQERLGYLMHVEADLERVIPLSLLGLPLSVPVSLPQAISILESRGLSTLMEPVWCRAPVPLPDQNVDLREVSREAPWRPMVVAEINPTTAFLRPAWPHPEERRFLVFVALPANDLLFPDQPDDL